MKIKQIHKDRYEYLKLVGRILQNSYDRIGLEGLVLIPQKEISQNTINRYSSILYTDNIIYKFKEIDYKTISNISISARKEAIIKPRRIEETMVLNIKKTNRRYYYVFSATTSEKIEKYIEEYKEEFSMDF